MVFLGPSAEEGGQQVGLSPPPCSRQPQLEGGQCLQPLLPVPGTWWAAGQTLRKHWCAWGPSLHNSVCCYSLCVCDWQIYAFAGADVLPLQVGICPFMRTSCWWCISFLLKCFMDTSKAENELLDLQHRSERASRNCCSKHCSELPVSQISTYTSLFSSSLSLCQLSCSEKVLQRLYSCCVGLWSCQVVMVGKGGGRRIYKE